MNEVHFINDYGISQKEQLYLRAAKTARTKTENSINEIKNAIAELKAENIKITQANVIRRLTGIRCKKTIIHTGKLYFRSTHPRTQFMICLITQIKNH